VPACTAGGHGYVLPSFVCWSASHVGMCLQPIGATGWDVYLFVPMSKGSLSKRVAVALLCLYV
jgi:hypothetical protein